MPDEFDDKRSPSPNNPLFAPGIAATRSQPSYFLVLPFIAFLGFETQNPLEVSPDSRGFRQDKRVDYAIIENEHPIIAIECKCCGAALKDIVDSSAVILTLHR